MDLELNQLESKNTFDTVVRSEVPEGAQVNKSTWVLRTKRRPDGSFIKKKARLCLRGDLQQLDQDDEEDETHAPVVDWATIRLMFVLAIACGLATVQIDFKNAFTQSSLPSPIHMEMPPGCETKEGDKVL